MKSALGMIFSLPLVCALILLSIGTTEGSRLRDLGAHWRWWDDPNVRAQLNLTEDQVNRIREKVRSARESLIDLRAAMEKKALTIEDEVQKKDFDLSKAMAALDAFQRARCALEEQRLRLLLEIRSILQRDQYLKLRSLLQRRRANRKAGPLKEPKPLQ